LDRIVQLLHINLGYDIKCTFITHYEATPFLCK
jgi:hypothetical protein